MAKLFFPFALMTASAKSAVVEHPSSVKTRLKNSTSSDTPIEEQLADSFNANNDVMTYVLSLCNSSLPVLSPVPDWYTQFMTDFGNAKVHAMRWTNTIAPGLQSIPQSIIDFSAIFSLNYTNIKQALPILEEDPENESARSIVNKALQNLISGLKDQKNTALNFKAMIKDFQSTMTSDANMMQNAISSAEETKGYDQDKVDNLLKDIDDLRNEVNKWQTVITATGIAGGVSIFGGCVVSIFTLGFGIAFAVAAAVATITTILVASSKIDELNLKIQKDELDMDSLNQQISALKALQKTLSTLIEMSGSAGDQVALILQAWDKLETELNTVISDLDSADTTLYLNKVTELENELNQANTDWQTLVTYCQLIGNIKYNEATPAKADLPHETAHAA